MSLYSLTDECRNLYDALMASADEETGEVDISLVNALAERQEAWEDKAVAVACVYRSLDEDAARVGREIERLTAMKKRLERERDRVKEGLSAAFTALGVEKVKGMYADISFRASEQTIIDNADAVPEEYMTVKTTYTPNKTAIREAIKAGKEVPGAHLEQKKNIQIK
ncbi:MAG TPA: siphovirus Gp157 family protein [Firmicutes bacterium]|nr:siphovirus Gp157 family protein [Bacillota bacterium]